MLTLILVVALVQGGAASGTPNQQETATIRGRVTEKDTGAALPRALVHINMKDVARTVRTDGDGRFEISGLPPGSYIGFVRTPEHRPTHVDQPLRDARGPLVLRAGEVRDDLNVSLPRALAIDVRVVDDEGGPLSRVRIRLTDGRTGADTFGARNTTDDQGRARVFGLPPGRYIVCAEPQGMASLGENKSAKRERFLRTCYPSAESERTAEPIRLEQADAGEIQIVMRRGRTFTLSGTVVDSTGAPTANAQIILNRFERNGGSGMGGVLAKDGTFRFTNVHPGDYALTAEASSRYRPEYRGPSEKSYYPVSLGPDSSDVEGIVIVMSRTVDVSGRFILENSDVGLPPPPGSGLMVSDRLADDPLPGTGSAGYARADESRAFVLEGLFGRRLLDIGNLPRGWYVKSIRYEGRDVFETPTEFKGGDSSIEIVLSDRGAVVRGRVLDERGEPASNARVLMFPARKKRWGDHELMTAVTNAGGTFRIGPQRAGEYLVVALPRGTSAPHPEDFEGILTLAEGAERIRLGENEERALDLSVRRQP